MSAPTAGPAVRAAPAWTPASQIRHGRWTAAPSPLQPPLAWRLMVAGAVVSAPVLIAAGFLLCLDRAAANLMILDPVYDYTIGLLWAAFILAVLPFLPFLKRHRRPLAALWFVKSGVALGAMLFYESYYSLDAASYFNDGVRLLDPAGMFRFGSGTENVTALVGLAAPLTFGSYSALKVLWAFIGLLAIYLFYLAYRLYARQEDTRVLYLFGLFPSVLFWSSTLGKDPLTLFGLGFFSLGVVGILRSGRVRSVALAALGLIVATCFRPWLGVIFLVPFLVCVVLARQSNLFFKVACLLVIVPAFLVAMHAFADQFAIENARDVVARTDTISQSWAYGGAGQTIAGGFGSITSMLLFVPLGVFTALFRPLPGEVMSPFGLIAGLENFTLLALLASGLWRRNLGRLRDPVLMWAALTVIVWGAVYGFVSYQNLGTAFRFKLQVMPLILLLLFALRLKTVAAKTARYRSRSAATDARVPNRNGARPPGLLANFYAGAGRRAVDPRSEAPYSAARQLADAPEPPWF